MVSSCAQQGAPPGGPEDLRPPIVIHTVPDTFEIVQTLDGLIRFEFDERISERVASGTLDDAVIISPRTGEVLISHGSRSLTVGLEGGFRPDIVYRVTLLPVVSDLFGNQMRDPFELIFSTGAETVPTTVAGITWDRVTGSGVDDYQVWAIPLDDDSVVHVAVTDNQGVYAFRYIPGASYKIIAFDDQNADAIVDMMEMQGSAGFSIEDGDTVFLNLPVLVPDTTPAVLVTASVLDSVTLLLEFDDYLDPEAGLETTDLTVISEDSTDVLVDNILHEHDYVAYLAMVIDSLATLDSLDAALEEAAIAAMPSDRAARDSTINDVNTSQENPDPELIRRLGPPNLDGSSVSSTSQAVGSNSGGMRQTGGPDGEQLPARYIVVLLGEPLSPGTRYNLAVSGLENLYGLSLGSGEASLFIEPVAITDTATVMDSILVPDTGSVVSASLGLGHR